MIIKNKQGQLLLDTDSYEISGPNPTLIGADFRGQIIEGLLLYDITFEDADFSGANLYWFDLFMSRFINCTLRNATISGSDWKNVDFGNADLTDAVFTIDNLGGFCEINDADLSRANLTGTDFKACEYNRGTRFPAGFDPQRAGLRFVE